MKWDSLNFAYRVMELNGISKRRWNLPETNKKITLVKLTCRAIKEHNIEAYFELIILVLKFLYKCYTEDKIAFNIRFTLKTRKLSN